MTTHCFTHFNLYCTLHNPQQERFIGKKNFAYLFVVYSELHAAISYGVHLFERCSNVTALRLGRRVYPPHVVLFDIFMVNKSSPTKLNKFRMFSFYT